MILKENRFSPSSGQRGFPLAWTERSLLPGTWRLKHLSSFCWENWLKKKKKRFIFSNQTLRDARNMRIPLCASQLSFGISAWSMGIQNAFSPSFLSINQQAERPSWEPAMQVHSQVALDCNGLQGLILFPNNSSLKSCQSAHKAEGVSSLPVVHQPEDFCVC